MALGADAYCDNFERLVRGWRVLGGYLRFDGVQLWMGDFKFFAWAEPPASTFVKITPAHLIKQSVLAFEALHHRNTEDSNEARKVMWLVIKKGYV